MGSALDKNGKTEQEFLRDYDVTRYFRPSVTVDAVLYRRGADGLKILFIKRGGHPFLGDFAFPGGFVEENEPCEAAVLRELKEETNIEGVALKQLVTASTPGRDPRWRNITAVFCGEVGDGVQACADDDAAETAWLDVVCDDGGKMTFRGMTASGARVAFDCKLCVKYDAFGAVDLNATEMIERGSLAFDHAKIVYYLYNMLKGV